MRRFVVALGTAGTLGLITAAASASATPVDLQSLVDAAPSGETITLEPTTYRGGVVIAKPLTILGSGAVIDAGGVGTGIIVTSPGVTLRDLTIRHTGASLLREDAAISADGAPGLTIDGCTFEDALFGVFLKQSPGATVRNTVIGAKDLDPARRGDALRLWESDAVTIEGNTIVGGRDSVAFFSDDLVVRSNHLQGGRYGLHFMYASGALVAENLLEGNSVGAFVMYSTGVEFIDNVVVGSQGPSGYGLGLKDVDDTLVVGNRFIGNRVGIYLDNAPISADGSQVFTGNLLAHNRIGILFTPAVRGNAFWGNAFVDNREQVAISGGGTLTGNTWTVDGIGNHWDDFAGYDANGDGIGDIPYRLVDLYSAASDRNPAVAFFADTPAARVVSLTARLFPELRPSPKVVDDAPLVAVPHMAAPAITPADATSSSLVHISLVLLALTASLLTLSRPIRIAA